MVATKTDRNMQVHYTKSALSAFDFAWLTCNVWQSSMGKLQQAEYIQIYAAKSLEYIWGASRRSAEIGVTV